MKREIKFRIWNGREMEYSIVAGTYGKFYVNPECGNGLDPRDKASLTPNNTKYPDDTPLMQFTGLTDKNGKEIYEGDILRFYGFKRYTQQSFPECRPEIDEYIIIKREEVVFCEKGCFVTKSCIDEFYYTTIDGIGIIGIEVIGNIYENPDLL